MLGNHDDRNVYLEHTNDPKIAREIAIEGYTNYGAGGSAGVLNISTQKLPIPMGFSTQILQLT